MTLRTLILLLVASLPGRLAAAPAPQQRSVAITPASGAIGYSVYALGMMKVSGAFERFRGVATLRPADPAACRVQVSVEVASLHMPDPGQTRQSLAPNMLDAARFPTMVFTGACRGKTLAGRLTLHGVTRKFSLELHRDKNKVSGTGTLARADFGVNGMAGVVGSSVEIRLVLNLPPPR